jgi:hypothetical protein
MRLMNKILSVPLNKVCSPMRSSMRAMVSESILQHKQTNICQPTSVKVDSLFQILLRAIAYKVPTIQVNPLESEDETAITLIRTGRLQKYRAQEAKEATIIFISHWFFGVPPFQCCNYIIRTKPQDRL